MLERTRRRSASAAPTVAVTIVALAVLLIGEGATALGGGGGGGGGDGGGGRGYNDDDNECPFSYNVFVGADGTFEVQAASACRFRLSSCIPAFLWAKTFTVPPITSMNNTLTV